MTTLKGAVSPGWCTSARFINQQEHIIGTGHVMLTADRGSTRREREVSPGRGSQNVLSMLLLLFLHRRATRGVVEP